ncbi:HlyD family type I secretion periplasmic adaptor subunit [Mesorhizobium sp. ES1-4]|uniref:HlyD family type I secretion periplasmic adaptor subunit n=1 Tax=Mesorhizobium sp. ES1-4 TaxID=2876627 RepID=UPI001CCA09CB|nr:HlyD family type I secretion periplasmic adaptor subunit [Mesorhizobium sp. ES1-4]MBZ9799556.1 HlyD family type I secretion periplasmic adaptor subunit [Mesorhizobium sp. ES1-4]
MDKNIEKKIRRPHYTIHSRVAVSGLLALGLILGCGGWAANAKLSGAIIAQGKVTAKKQLKMIQHRDGGIIGAIEVANGDAVKVGDVLIRLDETQTRAELGVLSEQFLESQGRAARLRAERDDMDKITFDFAPDADPQTIMDGEQRLFANNRATRVAQKAQLKSQIDQDEEQIRGLEAQKASSKSERALVAEDIDRLAPLLRKGLIEGDKTRTLERDLVKVDGHIAEVESDIARAKGAISEVNLKIIELEQQVKTDAQRELRDVEAKVAELDERIVAARDRLSRMELRAPISGTVNDLKVHTVDGVIAPGETVMSIVPIDDELVIEARVAPTDIDQVSMGQDVKLRFSSFSQRTTPQIDGRVKVVGAAASIDAQTGQAYYLSTIAIGDVDGLEGKQLVPGMPVEVFLHTRERSALSYLVKPFTDQMNRAMRED